MTTIVMQANTSGVGSITLSAPSTGFNQVISIPDATTSLVGTDTTQTLSNKTLTTPNIDSAPFATVVGTAPIYGCRAWVNFNGTGTVAIRASGNVSSITDNGVGDYTVNFTNAMADANYAAACSAVQSTSTNIAMRPYPFGNYGSGSLRVRTADTGNNIATDADTCFVAIFR